MSAIHTVGGQNSFVARSASTAASIAAGSALASSTLTAPRWMLGVKKQCSCAEWKSGSAWTSTSSGVISPSTKQLVCWAIRERLVSIVPLGRDSVPLV